MDLGGLHVVNPRPGAGFLRPSRATLRWFLATIGFLALLLFTSEWFDFFILGNQSSARFDGIWYKFEDFWFFLWAFPFCHFVGLSLTNHYSPPKTLLTALAAGGVMGLAGIGLTVGGMIVGILLAFLLGKPSIYIAPAIAGIAYGLILSLVQIQIFGRTAVKRRWRNLHLKWGAIAGVIVFFSTYSDQLSPTGTFSLDPFWSNLKTVLVLIAVALPHYIGGWWLAVRQRSDDGTPPTQRWRRTFNVMRIVVIGIGLVATTWLIWRYADPRFSRFESRPPGHSADGRYVFPIGDQTYLIPPNQIRSAGWESNTRRYGHVGLHLEIADDAQLVDSDPSTEEPFKTVWIDDDGGPDSTPLLPCKRNLIGPLIGCWLPSHGAEGLWKPSPKPDLWIVVRSPELAIRDFGILLLDNDLLYVAALDPGIVSRDDIYDLIVRDGSARWHIPISANNFPHILEIISAVTTLQTQLRYNPVTEGE